MIAANKNGILDTVLYLYFRHLAQGSFHTVAARGLDHLRNLPKDRPVIIFSNHTNWWDGLMVFLLSRQMRPKAIYCMMEEKQLKHYKFFTWLGAFSVDLSNPLRMAASMRYALRLLNNPGTALWIFPQGKLCPPVEPIMAKPGTNYLAQLSPQAVLLPVAMRYEFFREDRPNVLIEIGQTFPANESSDEIISAQCNAMLASLIQATDAQDLTGFERIFPPRLPINKRWEWVKLAARGKLSEFNPAN